MIENFYNDDARLYLQMMQENITRMATNSANAKAWTVAIVSAMLAIGCKIDDLNCWLLLAVIPIGILWFMDAYYLRLERALRNREQYFINILRGKESVIDIKEVFYDFRPLNKQDNKDLRYVDTGWQLFNISVWPLYVVLTVIDIIITVIVNESWRIII